MAYPSSPSSPRADSQSDNTHIPTNHSTSNVAGMSNSHLSAAAPVFRPGGSANTTSGNIHLTPYTSSGKSSAAGSDGMSVANRAAPPPRLGLNPNAMPFSTLRLPDHSPFATPSHHSQQPGIPMAMATLPSPMFDGRSISPGGLSPHVIDALSPGYSGSGGLSPQSGIPPRLNRRGSRGVPSLQPFKTTGHNSKPSVSMTPAALSQMLAAHRPKRKTVVKLPNEGSEEESEQDDMAERGEGEDEEQDAAIEKERQRLRFLRSIWPRRRPTELQASQEETEPLLQTDTISCEVYPQPADRSEGLPDFIDIYLPGQAAWEDVKETMEQENLGKMNREDVETNSSEEGQIDDIDNIAADAASEGKIGRKILESPPLAPPPQANIAAIHSSDVTTALNISQAPSSLLTSTSPRSLPHSKTMSLSMPSSGPSFGHSTLTALGLPSPGGERTSLSDNEEHEPALGERPHMERRTSADAVMGKRKGVPSSTLKELGRGFGYDIEEADEDGHSDAEGQFSSHSLANPSFSQGIDIVRENRGAALDEWNVDHSSDLENDLDSDNHFDEEDELSSDPDDSRAFSGEFSNPSDEEAAREARMHRRAIRAEQRAGRSIARQRERALQRQGRPRSGTSETYASSNLHPVDTEMPVPRFSTNSRGPLDDGWPVATEFGDGEASTQAGAQDKETNSRLHPNAPVFEPRLFGTATSSHFRLPSIKNSSFGSSFGASTRSGLNAFAAPFTPSTFTFQPPVEAPSLPQGSHSLVPMTTGPLDGFENQQGREKRQRQRDERVSQDQINESTPPRPRPSAASVEGQLRGEMSSESQPPPFNSQSDLKSITPISQSQGVQGTFTFKPTAAPFQPSIRRGTQQRPGIPSSSFSVDEEIEGVHAENTPPSSVLTDDSVDGVGLGDPQLDQENDTFPPMLRGNSGRSADERRLPLTSVWPQTRQSAATSRRSSQQVADAIRLGGFERIAATDTMESGKGRHRSSSSCGGDGDSDEEDDDTVSDIIEELGDRMDKALEGWAGKILDEVTIMGQVRPVNMVTLDEDEKYSLVEMIRTELQDVVSNHFRQVQESIELLSKRQLPLLEGSIVGDDSTRTITPYAKTQHKSHSALDAQVEMDFDYVQDTLDQKISNLHRDLSAAFESVLPRTMENVLQQFRSAIDDTRLDKAIKLLEENASSTASREALLQDRQKPDPAVSQLAQLSSDNIEEITTLLVGRLQAVSQEFSDVGVRHRRAELTDVLEPIFEEHLQRNQAKAQADQQNLTHALTKVLEDRLIELESSLRKVQSTPSREAQSELLQSILPHLEMIRTDDATAHTIAAKITAALQPTLANLNGAGDARSTLPSELDKGTVEHITKLIVQLFEERQSLHATTRDLAGDNELVQRLTDAVVKNKQSTGSDENGSELNAVIALLEPLVERQEESRSLSRKILDNQGEMEHVLEVIPGALNAKLEIFLNTTQTMQDSQEAMMKKLNTLPAFEGAQLDESHIRVLEGHREELIQQLGRARQGESEARAELNECRAELNSSVAYTSTLKGECSRLESRLDQAEKDSIDITDQTAAMRSKDKETAERMLAAEQRAMEAEAKSREFEVMLQSSEEQKQLLRAHVEQLTADAAGDRDERARERESVAQAIAEALASRKDAEESLALHRKKVEELSVQSRYSDAEAREKIESHLERASKAEGQVATLEKRISEQDAKISNLQQLTATQKQKAAQSGQKLSEVEKKLKEMEEKDRELVVAHARLAEMETRLRDQDLTESRLRESQENEARLREEVAMHKASFLDVERDVMAMRESLVSRESLDEAQTELASSREEVALLRGQLAEAQRREGEQKRISQQSTSSRRLQVTEKGLSLHRMQALEHSPSHGSSTWASIHAPNSSTDEMDPTRPSFMLDDSIDSLHKPHRSLSYASNSRTVEINDEGWWT